MIVLIGIVVGLLLGLTGAGGSIFAVPLLMAGLGWSMPQAATTSLLAVSVAATFGTVMAWKHSYVRYRSATLMAIFGILFSPVGIHLADKLPPAELQVIFAVVLLLVALRMYYMAGLIGDDSSVVRSAVSGEGRPSVGKLGQMNPVTGRLIWTFPVSLVLSMIGTATGFLSGLLGVGGGFVIVPALRATLPLSMHSAVATSLMTIAITSQGGFLSGLLQGRQVHWKIALPFVAGAIIGMYLGRKTAPYISGHKLQRGFAIIAFIVSCTLIAFSIR